MENFEGIEAKETPTGIKVCFASGCRFNDGLTCAFRGVEIGKDGKCLCYEEQTDEHLRCYLEGRGLSAIEIEQVLKEAGKDAGAH